MSDSPIIPPLQIRNLSVRYTNDQNYALNGVDLDFTPGKMTAIIGPNGAGKSSLLKASLGLIPKAQGNIEFFGDRFENKRRKIAYIPQRSSIDWDFPISVREVVEQGLISDTKLWQFFKPKHHKNIALDSLRMVELESYSERQIGKLSGGQQQRMFIARALAQSKISDGADLFLLDEPLTGVDSITEKTIIRILKNLCAENKTVIAVHHNLQTVREYFDEVVLLNGAVIAHGEVTHAFTDDTIQKTYLPASFTNKNLA